MVIGSVVLAGPAAAENLTDCSAVHTAGRDTTQPLLYAKRGQYWYVRGSATSGPADVCFTFGNPGDIGIMGDWNGDGQQTPGVFRPSTGVWYLSNELFASQVDGVFRYGAAGDAPVVGDWDENGTQTLGVFRPSNGTWYLTNHDDSGIGEWAVRFASPGDQPVDMRAKDVLAVFRPSNATWYTYHPSMGLTEPPQVYGNPGDVSVGSPTWGSAGRGCSSKGVFRPTIATWYSQVVPYSWTFGNATDQMLVSSSNYFCPA
jgi:hypothetical protein